MYTHEKLRSDGTGLDGLKLATVAHHICCHHGSGRVLLRYASVPPPFESFPIFACEPLHRYDCLTVLFMPLRPCLSLALLSAVESVLASAALLQTVTDVAFLHTARSTFLLPILPKDTIVGVHELCYRMWQNHDGGTLFQSNANAPIHEIMLLCVRQNKSVTLSTLLGQIFPAIVGMNPDGENSTTFVFDINPKANEHCEIHDFCDEGPVAIGSVDAGRLKNDGKVMGLRRLELDESDMGWRETFT